MVRCNLIFAGSFHVRRRGRILSEHMEKVGRIFDSAAEADGLLDMQLTPESLNSNEVEDHASSLHPGGLLLAAMLCT